MSMQLPALANISMPVAKFIHQIGEYLIEDDRDDLFKTVYYDDKNHFYHGEKHPDHPGFMHHWMIGGICVFTGQMLGAMNMAREVMYMRQESIMIDGGDLDDIPLPGGKRIIPIPYREVRRQPAPRQNQYQKLLRKIDSIAKI